MTSRRFLALGDSYTIGESVDEADRWPNQLAAMLRRQGIALQPPTIIAQTGWTTSELLTGIDEAQPSGLFDVVSLQIGVNNQYRGLDLQKYAEEFETLLDVATDATRGPSRVIVLSIPDWGVTPFAAKRDNAQIGREIDRFNHESRHRAHRRGCHFVDVTPISRDAAKDPALLATDELHPSGRMYAKWCELALSSFERVLGESSNGIPSE